VSESLYEDAVSRAVLDLQQSYARRVRAESSWQAAREAADLLKTRLASAEQRFDKGIAPLPEVERARLSWLAAKEDALVLQTRTLQEHLSLLRACGGP
jgi:outer membrane protein TolC